MTGATDNNRRRLDAVLRGSSAANMPALKSSAARIASAARKPEPGMSAASAAHLAAGQAVFELAAMRRRAGEVA